MLNIAGNSINLPQPQVLDGMFFSTKDNDNDIHDSGNCATTMGGNDGWWYRNCHYANLNGRYGDDSYHDGIIWGTWHGMSYSMPFTEMKTKPM